MPVWGINPGSGSIKVPWKNGSIKVQALKLGNVVGLEERAEQLEAIELALPTGVTGDEVMKHAREQYQIAFKSKGLSIYFTRLYGSDNVRWRLFGSLPGRSIESVSLVGGNANTLLEDTRKFLTEEAIYDKNGRPYKLVVCLYGPPGTGKTSTVIAIASELGKDLAIFNVDSLRDDTFIDLLSDLPRGAVVMFEDVDAMFKSRESKTGSVTFSGMLNALDGILHPRGAIIFLTTNHIERLDEAIYRPGRVDRLIEVGNSTASQRVRMWKSMFPNLEVPTMLLKERPDISPAWLSAILFQNRDAPEADVLSVLTTGLHELGAQRGTKAKKALVR